MEDSQLLEAYARNGSSAAFEELARRYVRLVYSAALQEVRGDVHLADDVTQVVFLILARKAGRLNPSIVLSGWLLTATRFAAKDVMKMEARRKRHEQSAAKDQKESSPGSSSTHSSEPDWERVAPLLDTALAGLSEPHRASIALRFFERRNYKEVADRLQITEVAARQRVSRAIEQLRAFFARRGIMLSVDALAGLIAANAVQSAPATTIAAIVSVGAKGAAASARHVAIAQGAVL